MSSQVFFVCQIVRHVSKVNGFSGNYLNNEQSNTYNELTFMDNNQFGALRNKL